jgi:hypothetical protein
VEDWPGARIWEELHVRLSMPGFTLNEGEFFSKNMLETLSRVSEPMLHRPAAHRQRPSAPVRDRAGGVSGGEPPPRR